VIGTGLNKSKTASSAVLCVSARNKTLRAQLRGGNKKSLYPWNRLLISQKAWIKGRKAD
jgi:hypothetical protein